MNGKISVVIPAYNASKYIGKMLLSLSKQTYRNFEVVLVDDGSTDDTLEVVKKSQCLFDGSLKIVAKKNGGVSQARNLGIQIATGEFIVFVDADDTVENNYLHLLVSPLKENTGVDLSIIGYYSEFDNGKLKYKTTGQAMEMSYKVAIYNSFILFEYEGYPWNKMYRTSVIKKYNLRFNEQIAVCEDLLFFIEYTMHVKKVSYNPASMYHYLLHEDSTINSRDIGNYFSESALTELQAYKLMEKIVPDDLKKIHEIMLTRQTWTNSYLSRLIFAAPNQTDLKLTEQYKKMRAFQKKNALYFLKYAKYDLSHKTLFILNIISPRLVRFLDMKRKRS